MTEQSPITDDRLPANLWASKYIADRQPSVIESLVLSHLAAGHGVVIADTDNELETFDDLQGVGRHVGIAGLHSVLNGAHMKLRERKLGLKPTDDITLYLFGVLPTTGLALNGEQRAVLAQLVNGGRAAGIQVLITTPTPSPIQW